MFISDSLLNENGPNFVMIRTADNVESPAVVMRGISVNCIHMDDVHFIGIVLNDNHQALAAVTLLNPDEIDTLVNILLEAKSHFLGTPPTNAVN